MTHKTRPNDPCPCGSGKKFKKCCNAPGSALRMQAPTHTQADRASAWGKMGRFLYGAPDEEAVEEFWGDYLDRGEELPDELMRTADDVFDAWFFFDWRFEDGSRLVDDALAEASLTPGERTYLTAMRDSSMRLYEVVGSVPDTSITLRDVLEGDTVTVHERSASRAVWTRQCIAARVIPRGCSGEPELEVGLFHIPDLLRDPVVAALRDARAEYLAHDPGASIGEFYEAAVPLLSHPWLMSIFDPVIPRLANFDGEELAVTRVIFAVDDEAALRAALDASQSEGIARDGHGAWVWSGTNESGGEVSLGRIDLRNERLRLETNSVERGARGRELLERLAGGAIRYRATSHEDLQSGLARAVTARTLGQNDGVEMPASAGLDPELAASLVLQHLDGHYRSWIDEPVPALDGSTPREAALRADLRPRVEDLILDLEGMYARALKSGTPAHDPSWMWAELGLPGPGARADVTAEGDDEPAP